MNKRKQEYERRRILNTMRPLNRHPNRLQFYKNESDNHAHKKYKLFRILQKEGFEIYSEVIFKSGKRADLVAIKDGLGYGFEVLESETIKKCEKKIKDYPKIIEWHIISSYEDIKNLEI